MLGRDAQREQVGRAQGGHSASSLRALALCQARAWDARLSYGKHEPGNTTSSSHIFQWLIIPATGHFLLINPAFLIERLLRRKTQNQKDKEKSNPKPQQGVWGRISQSQGRSIRLLPESGTSQNPSSVADSKAGKSSRIRKAIANLQTCGRMHRWGLSCDPTSFYGIHIASQSKLLRF